jgi:hypothetical protein
MAQKAAPRLHPRVFQPLDTNSCDGSVTFGIPIPYKDGHLMEGDFQIGGALADGTPGGPNVLFNVRLNNEAKDQEALIITLFIEPTAIKQAVKNMQPQVAARKKQDAERAKAKQDVERALLEKQKALAKQDVGKAMAASDLKINLSEAPKSKSKK